MQNNQILARNPLAAYMRQPKIYIKLPSQGRYWEPGSIALPPNGELAVFSMTARDELIFKTPDALMNGQAIVDVIQNCIPNIKDAWKCPSIDLDTILIAIRLATYGEKIDFKHTIPNINEEIEYQIDLRTILDQQQNNIWIEQVVVSPELVVFVKPLTYKHLTQTGIKTFETKRILNMVNDDSLSEEKKIELFQESFKNLTRITVDLMSESVYKIITPESEVTDATFISEFVNNVDKDVFEKINKHISDLKTQNEVKPLEFSTTGEQQANGAPATYTVPVDFNESNFFA